jgi:hypothetical protein
MSSSLKLSPLNLSGLLADWRANEKPEHSTVAKPRRRAIEVIKWACPVCNEQYEEDEEKDAEACCQGNGTDQENPCCPVCKRQYIDHREAADCCLWKDIDALTRYRIADAVEAGSSWAEELGLQTVEA